ncbi:Aste57867_25023 [Aphanomyces stellatus]|uniref:Aste57867_25023 protein n=1 Tax=Aphanomyces stellatus TaxID=120398 RepID=A0A485LSX3_9STRA|nr:hypothetical protein As57867_024945 [Aphanomyces stellatus]VFU01654.1 Aste57867_25023 [Aphanomyces stellatus]
MPSDKQKMHVLYLQLTQITENTTPSHDTMALAAREDAVKAQEGALAAEKATWEAYVANSKLKIASTSAAAKEEIQRHRAASTDDVKAKKAALDEDRRWGAVRKADEQEGCKQVDAIQDDSGHPSTPRRDDGGATPPPDVHAMKASLRQRIQRVEAERAAFHQERAAWTSTRDAELAALKLKQRKLSAWAKEARENHDTTVRTLVANEERLARVQTKLEAQVQELEVRDAALRAERAAYAQEHTTVAFQKSVVAAGHAEVDRAWAAARALNAGARVAPRATRVDGGTAEIQQQQEALAVAQAAWAQGEQERAATRGALAQMVAEMNARQRAWQADKAAWTAARRADHATAIKREDTWQAAELEAKANTLDERAMRLDARERAWRRDVATLLEAQAKQLDECERALQAAKDDWKTARRADLAACKRQEEGWRGTRTRRERRQLAWEREKAAWVDTKQVCIAAMQHQDQDLEAARIAWGAERTQLQAALIDQANALEREEEGAVQGQGRMARRTTPRHGSNPSRERAAHGGQSGMGDDPKGRAGRNGPDARGSAPKSVG